MGSPPARAYPFLVMDLWPTVISEPIGSLIATCMHACMPFSANSEPIARYMHASLVVTSEPSSLHACTSHQRA